ncbi:hypothetical protein ACEPAI_9118 [Sanghuangporus weigelae]
MSINPILALFQRLIELCRQYAKNGLRWLFRLFSLLVKRLEKWRTVGKTELEDEKSEIREVRDDRSLSTTTKAPMHVPSSSIPSERTVVLACSTTPTKPPRVKLFDHARSRSELLGSIEGQLASNATTLVDSPTSEIGFDTGSRFCASPERYGSIYSASPSLGSIEEHKEATFSEGGLRAVPDSKGGGTFVVGETYAEPAGMGSKSGEGQRKEIKPIAPSERPRYDRNIVIKNKTDGWKFGPLETYDLLRVRNVKAWDYFVHPEGVPYYLYVSLPGFSFLTEANLQDSAVLEEVETFMNDLEKRIDKFNWEGKRPENVEVVLEIQEDWTYYMVDLDKRVVFWIDEFDGSIFCGRDYGVGERDHFVGQFEFEYWVHIEHFPNHRDVQIKWFGEALGILNYWRVDVISSADSTAPYDQHDLNSLIGSVHQLETRVMSVAANERHHNFYGSPGARIQVWQSVRGQRKNERLWLVKYMSPLLFYAPETHLSGLEKQWVDGVLQERRWKKYQLKLERDWESFVITSTVLLNANVAMLSTPIIFSDNGGDDNSVLFASPASVASQVSIVASIASIIIGLLLIRQIRISSKDIDITAIDAVEYLSSRKHGQLGLETMAIQYSLPYALLMWGMVTFLTSIAIACFFGIDGWPNTLVKMIYAVSWLFIIPLILWTVITGWETNNHKHIADLASREWWLSLIERKKEEQDGKKPWTWFNFRKAKGKSADPEAIDLSGRDTAHTATPEPITPINESDTQTVSNEQRNWRVRVKNFGPVRHLSLLVNVPVFTPPIPQVRRLTLAFTGR